MPNQIQAGPQTASDLTVVNARGDNYGNTTIQPNGAYYQELVRRGYGFHYTQTTAGIALTAPGTGAKTNFLIWNPLGSGKYFVPLKITLGLVSTTAVLGNIAIFSCTGLGANVGTGAPVVSFTAGTATNALVGSTSAPASVMNFIPTTHNLTTAPALIKTLGWSILANDLASKTTWNFETDLQGSLVFAPGSAFMVGPIGAVASVCVISCFGLELPIPPGA